jgi:eukaryotic-like serine/threonine-protein kinase
MPLPTGTRLGPYEILTLVGAGGMGEVYRARDTKLQRDIAVKVLPDLFVTDPERLARFKREAQVLASLNHPNIAAIYGVEDSNGVEALVLELVDGPTLADRIAQGPIPMAEALAIARQTAEALEAAHEHGIVHRDLKPANVKLRPDGTVKVLDFGLAKALDRLPTSAGVTPSSPTITAQATQPGMILGTAAYMSPEQAQGKHVDRGTDIWAFGAVLFEMITARRAFEADNVSTTLAKIIEREPDWNALPPNTSAAIRHLLRRCLEKDRRRRLRDAGEARIAVEDALSRSSSGQDAGPEIPSGRMRQRSTIAIAGVTLAAVLLIGFLLGGALSRPSQSPPGQTVHFTIVPPPAQSVSINGLDRDLAVSPDGRYLVYVGGVGHQLIVRSLDRLEAVPLAGTAGARMPFISADGRWVGFFAGGAGELRKVPITGGPPVTLCRYQQGPRGASWAPDDTLVFATSDTGTGLLSVTTGTGEAKVLTSPDAKQGERDHLFPSMLPGGSAVLFTVVGNGSIENAQIAVLNLRTNERTT